MFWDAGWADVNISYAVVTTKLLLNYKGGEQNSSWLAWEFTKHILKEIIHIFFCSKNFSCISICLFLQCEALNGGCPWAIEWTSSLEDNLWELIPSF